MTRLAGRTALITAAGSGMGRASALRFAGAGAHVYVTDVREDAAQATTELVTAAGGSATAVQVDVTDLAALAAVVQRVERERGVLHVLYNHAGVPGAAGLGATPADWDLAVDVNMKSAYYLTSYAVELLKRAEGKASVLFTSSVSGLTGSPYSPLYSMAKGGIVMLAKALALHLAPHGIRCNAICPAGVQTPMLPAFLDRKGEGLTAEQMDAFFTASVPLGRAGRAEEIADAALFLACDESSYITGIALPVDGGYTAR